MKFRSLQWQFRLWTIFLVVVPSLLIIAIYTISQINFAKEQHLELIRQRVHSQMRLVDFWLSERSDSVIRLSHLGAFRSLDRQQMRHTLDLAQQDDNNFDSLSYIDKDGYFQMSTLNTGIRYPSAIGKPYFETAKSGRDYVSDVVIGRNSGQPIINFSSPVYDYAGEFQGLILGSVRTSTLEMLLRENWIGQTGEVVLVNREGVLLTEPRNLNTLIAKGLIQTSARFKLRMPDEGLRSVRSGKSGVAVWTDFLGEKVMGAYAEVPEHGWIIVGKISEEEVLSPVYRQLAVMAGGAAFMVLLILLLGNLFTNKIKRPIEWLIEQSNLFVAENYRLAEQAGPKEKMPYELARLCETLGKMSRKIERTVALLKENENTLESKLSEIEDMNAALEEEIAERQAAQEALRQLNTELESKVAERTRELQDMNAALEEEVLERQMAQDALQESQERYEALVKQSSDAIVIVNYETLQIVEVNEAFLTMFGFRQSEVNDKTINELGLVEYAEIDMIKNPSGMNGAWVRDIWRYSRRDGPSVIVERAGSIVHHRGRQLILLSFRDISEQQKLQAEIQKQVEVAGVVQKSLLSPDYEGAKLAIRTIFKPLNLVSGDYYGYRWSNDTNSLVGYVIDATGHGVATALYTAGVSSLLNAVMENDQEWTSETLSRLNDYLLEHFRDGSFVAFIGFALDFGRRQLTCISGGINYMLAANADQCRLLAIPGSYLGVSKTPEFQVVTLPVQNGDAFYFMTDGILDKLSLSLVQHAYHFDDTVQALESLVSERNRDDCSALCLRITGLKFVPRYFRFSDKSELPRIRHQISEALDQLAGDNSVKLGLAFLEAITNALNHGTQVWLKINKIGQRMILRVRNNGASFGGNARVKELSTIGLDMVFETMLDRENGRGIPIMMMWTDRLLYNREGNEVMLIKKI